MEGKLLQKLIAVVLVICLTAVNFIFVATSAVYAVSNSTKLANGDIVFKAYFKYDDKGTIQNVSGTTAHMSEGGKLYLSLKLENGVVLKGGNVEITDANFKIDDSKVSKTYVDNISTKDGKIDVALKDISYTDTANDAIEIELPIMFEEADEIPTSYFSMTNTYKLTGNYFKSSDKGTEIKDNNIVNTELRWSEKSVVMNWDGNFEKVIYLKDKTIVQAKFESNFKDVYSPKETETFTVNVPEIEVPSKDDKTKTEKVKPTSYAILMNGNKVDQNQISDKTLDTENKEISVETNFVKNNKIAWTNSGDTYKVIYVFEGVTDLPDPVVLNAKMNTKLYGREKVYDKEINNVYSNEEEGSIVTVTAESLSKDVYKGYMYANSDETAYLEKYDVEFSYIDGLETKIELKEDNFKTENDKTVSTNNQTEYKEIRINKDKLVKVLGEKGTLEILPDNKNINAISVDATNEADENGDIVITAKDLDGANSVTINVVNAENEGTLTIIAQKAIKGNANQSKDTLKDVTDVETKVEVTNNQEEDKKEEATTKTELKETKTEATLEMSNDNCLSTTVENDIEFLATLKTGTMDTDLLKQPTIKMIFPQDVESIDLSSVSALYAEQELEIEKSEVVDETIDGLKVKAILVKLKGEQINYQNKAIEGIKITIKANIVLNKMATSKDANIKMIYTNENSVEKEFTTDTKVSIQAPYGLITNTELTSFFEVVGKPGTQTLTATIVNNYNTAISDLAIIGVMPKTGASKEDFEKELRAQYKEVTSANSAVQASNVNEMKIEYSKDGKEWTDSIENATKYKVIPAKNKLDVGERITLRYTITVDTILHTFQVAYSNEGTEKVQDLKMNKMESRGDSTKDTDNKDESKKGETQTQEPTTVNEDEKITITKQAVTGNTTLKDGAELTAGQVIRYTYKITNNTNEAIENVKFIANHENANIFEEVTTNQQLPTNVDVENEFTKEQEIEGKSEFVDEIGKIEAGKTKVVTYQIRIKDNATTTKTTIKLTGNGIDEINEETTNPVKEAELKLAISNKLPKEYPIKQGKIFANTLSITNNTDSKLNNILVSITIPKELEFYELYDFENSNNYTLVQGDKNYVVFTLNELAGKTTKDMMLSLKMVAEEPEKATRQLQYQAQVNQNIYYSNQVDVRMESNVETEVKAGQTSNISDEVLKTGDKLIYTIVAKNVGSIKDVITIKDFVPEAAVIQKVSYKIGNETTNVENFENNRVVVMVELDPDEQVVLTIETQIDESKTGRETITNYATISGERAPEEVKTKEITYKLQANIKQEETKPEDGKQEETKPEDKKSDENKQDGTEKVDEDKQKTSGTAKIKEKISGKVWLDANKNGIRESSEKTLSGIPVYIADVKTGDYVKDDNGNKLETTTNNKGEYLFDRITDGKYVVIFKFDNVKYRNTEYRVKSATEMTNSDIITSKLSSVNDNINYGVTDTLVLNGKSLENIDAGLIENEVFDLTLNKYITKATVQNSAGTVVKQYNKEQLAKLEIDAKNLVGSTVLVEYTIEITNNGEIAGYANELIDYIPVDLTFSSEMNKDWYISTDGNLHTQALSKQLIEPGKSVSTKLTLVKTMTENNTGLTLNKAEIIRSSNELAIPDKDINTKSGSTSEAKGTTQTKPNEAELIVSVRTGVEYTIGIIVAIVALSATGIIIYTKKRKEA